MGTQAASSTAPGRVTPAINARGDEVYYFAFGSNMNAGVLTGRRKVVPLESLPVRLPGWALSFRMIGLPYVEPGFATIERVSPEPPAPTSNGNLSSTDPSSSSTSSSSGQVGNGSNGNGGSISATPSSSDLDGAPSSSGGGSGGSGEGGDGGRWDREVHGVVHRIRLPDWQRVMASEGVSGSGRAGYRVVEVECISYDGRRVRALTLEGQGWSLHPPSRTVVPSPRYLNLLREGARHYGVDPQYCAHLDALQPYDSSRTAVTLGRVVVAAAAVPLLLPLVPPVLVLRALRQREEKRNAANGDAGASSGVKDANGPVGGSIANGNGGGGGEPGVGVAATLAAAVPAAVRAAQDATDLTSKAAAVEAVVVPHAATAVPVAAAAESESPGAVARRSAEQGEAGQGLTASMGLPRQYTRSPYPMPSAVERYVSTAQWTLWAAHDWLWRPVIGSGSSNAEKN